MLAAYSPNTAVSWIFHRVRAFSRSREVANRRFGTSSSGSRSKAVMVFTQKNAELMAESEDLELKRRAAPEGSEKRSQESRQQVPGRESKGKRQLSVYQSDRDLREPQ